MTTPAVQELKAFVPARDFALAKRFYTALGFIQKSDGGGVAYFHCGDYAFLLHETDDPQAAAHCSMHLLVPDVHAWFDHVRAADLTGYAHVRIGGLQEQPWGMTEFTLTDPNGVCWHIAQNTPGFAPVGRIVP